MRYLEEVVTLQYDSALCNGCAMCVTVCPHAVFAMVEKRAALVDRGACMECGACALNCERQAIQVRSGVGCAAGIIAGLIAGTEPTCGCSKDSSDSSSTSSCC
jgi:NAD-dependent dihydropyrimidine dehydrogenase PreA subunit